MPRFRQASCSNCHKTWHICIRERGQEKDWLPAVGRLSEDNPEENSHSPPRTLGAFNLAGDVISEDDGPYTQEGSQLERPKKKRPRHDDPQVAVTATYFIQQGNQELKGVFLSSDGEGSRSKPRPPHEHIDNRDATYQLQFLSRLPWVSSEHRNDTANMTANPTQIRHTERFPDSNGRITAQFASRVTRDPESTVGECVRTKGRFPRANPFGALGSAGIKFSSQSLPAKGSAK